MLTLVGGDKPLSLPSDVLIVCARVRVCVCHATVVTGCYGRQNYINGWGYCVGSSDPTRMLYTPGRSHNNPVRRAEIIKWDQDCQPSARGTASGWQGKISLASCQEHCRARGTWYAIHASDNNCKCATAGACNSFSGRSGWTISALSSGNAELPVSSRKRLGQCQGHCVDHSDCDTGLYCYQRSWNYLVRGDQTVLASATFPHHLRASLCAVPPLTSLNAVCNHRVHWQGNSALELLHCVLLCHQLGPTARRLPPHT